MNFPRYAVTIQGCDEDGEVAATMLLAVDVSGGDSILTGYHCTSQVQGIDARRLFGGINPDDIIGLLPGARPVYEATVTPIHRQPAAALPPAKPPKNFEARRTKEVERSERNVKLIVDDLKNGIADGTFPVGRALPVRQELIKRYPDGVSQTSVSKAVRRLQQEGLLGPGTAAGTKVLARPRKAGEPSAKTTGPKSRGGHPAGSRRPSEAERAHLASLPVIDP